MPQIGYHTSTAGGYQNAITNAKKLNLDTFQMFLGSPRTWAYRELLEEEIEQFQILRKQHNYHNPIVHLNYLANPSTPDSDIELRNKVINVFSTEVERADILDIPYIVFHAGSHKGKGIDMAIDQIAKLANSIADKEHKVQLLIETSAGSKNSVASKFSEIAQLTEQLDDTTKFGVCLDTCHVFAAGYDLRTEEAVKNTVDEFDDIIGLKYLKVIHCNDSKGIIGDGKDRHEHIGKGEIGIEGFRTLLNDKRLKNLPFILETPSKGVKDDIQALRAILST